ncbi:peptidase M28 family protein [Fulvivirga sp. RKSG066]|uniref:M20/M25/M40 family metallo-hydrolase n=1 Tax=Fulvivirga aurantia TaxID=2529383 RepID=UPI0012BD2818|nr:M20/M25/M40 family metallo-hydrolase [Fulvivirga aurantia]MTI21395.1 peptidase M28 family protein [Fulvivirga aurantia]
MKYIFISLLLLIANYPAQSQSDEAMIRKIYNQALTKGESYEMLDYLSNEIGGRLSGSPQAAAAVEWSRQKMIAYGFDTVYLQEVMVPHWVRGKQEVAHVVNSKRLGNMDMTICAIGNSIGTGAQGVQGKIVEVKDFESLEKLGKKNLEGKIVFFNRPFDQTQIHTFKAYGGAVDQRVYGASEAAKYGAIGVVVRSMASNIDDVPHTGTLRYSDEQPKIPAVAISTIDAETLSQALEMESDMEFYFETHCEMLPDVLSYNVIGELKGSTKPNEYIVVGGHLDSWDLGDGSHDDGAGCVQSIEVLRIMKELNYKPNHTIRAVMFMNEENGMRGGNKYAEIAKEKGETHVAALESDSGGFTPRGFRTTGGDEVKQQLKAWSVLLEPYGLHDFSQPGGGADIGPLAEQGTVLFGLQPDSQRYFNYHHTTSDTFDKVNKRELELGAAAMTSLVYLIDKNGL